MVGPHTSVIYVDVHIMRSATAKVNHGQPAMKRLASTAMMLSNNVIT
jgi:hypothetical protein